MLKDNKRIMHRIGLAALFCGAIPPVYAAIHVDPSVEDCTIRLAPALTQAGFSRFAREFGYVLNNKMQPNISTNKEQKWAISFNMGRSPIDQNSSAWNDTFVHPDAMHELGNSIGLPMLPLTRKITAQQLVGISYTNNPLANYAAGNLEYVHVLGSNELESKDKTYIRANFSQLSRTEDISSMTLAVEMVRRKSFSGYNAFAGLGVMAGSMSERSVVVNLTDENFSAVYGMSGVAKRFGNLELALQADIGTLTTFGFNTSYHF